jgi:GAF domain-containing protein
MTEAIDPTWSASRPAHAGGHALADRISVVQNIAERLSDVVEPADLAHAVISELRSGLGATAFVLAVVSDEGSGFSPLATEGVTDGTKAWLSGSKPEAAWRPAMEAVGAGRPLFWSSIADRDRQSPEYSERLSIARSWAVLPLMVRGHLIGALSIGWPVERPFTEVETTILKVIAHQCAVALDRARLEQTRRAERATLELLSEGTRVMVSALEPPSVINALVHLAVPRLAPWCGVYVGEGRSLRRVAIQIAGDRRLASELEDELALAVDDDHPLATAFRTGETVIVTIEESLVRALYAPSQAERILGRGKHWTALAVPIKASGKVIGVMSLVSDSWGSSPPDDVRFAAEGLAARAGVALVNARRFEDERATAALLMEAVLPRELPDVPGYELAARYLPAGGRVAGDWYDATLLPSGGYLIGIGDVGGHGIQAATLMGQLRNAARGFAFIGRSPAAILGGLHLVTADGDECFATAAYGILDPVENALRWSSAGHLPPLEFSDGDARYLEHRPSPPLGCPGPTPTEQRTLLRSPGSGLVLVTDGVVENRQRSLDEGMERLRALVGLNAGAGANRLIHHITEDLCEQPQDDCCIVVLKRR